MEPLHQTYRNQPSDRHMIDIIDGTFAMRDEKITANTNLLCHKVKRNFMQPNTAHVH